jgi:uncharacterized membrane protein
VIASQRHAGLKLIAQAVVERDDQGQVHIHEPGRGGVGASTGVIAGGLLGLLGGPVGVLALMVAGGVAGGVAGHFIGRVIPAEDLRNIGQSLPLNSSGFIVIADATQSTRAIETMKAYTGNVVVVTAGSELSGIIGQAVLTDAPPPSDADSTAQAGAAPAAESQAPPASA